MPNFIESLICEYVSYHMLVADERGAMPLPAEDGMERPSASACRAPVPESVAPGASPLRPQLFVTVLEAGDDGLLVRWSESGRCHYGEQRWRLRVALQAGRCAISGPNSGASTARCTSSTFWSTAMSTVGTGRPRTRASSMS